MNIKDINLLDIKQRIMNNELSEDLVQLVNRILFGFQSTLPTKCDLIIVLGNPTCLDDRIPKAVDLWKYYKGTPRLLLSGGVIIEAQNELECIAMKNACLSAGINNNQILIEDQSTTTNENIMFCSKIVNDMDIPNLVAVVVSSPSHIRRVMMNFEKHKALFPSNFCITPVCSDHKDCNHLNWSASYLSRKHVAIEIGYVHMYLYDLGYPEFDF